MSRRVPFVLVLFATACTLPASLQPRSSAPAPDPAQSAQSSTTDVGRVYAGWAYNSCPRGGMCSYKLAEAAGIHFDGNGGMTNPKPTTRNPDPDWIPGWDALPADDRHAQDFFEALNLAASNRTWLAACHAHYAAVKKALDHRQAEAADAIAKVQAITEPYARLTALLRLPGRPTPHPTSLREFALGSDAAAYDTERAIIAGFRDAGKLWVFVAEGHASDANNTEPLVPRWDPSFEEKAYCMTVAAVGTDDLPPLPQPDPIYTESIVNLVKPVFSEKDHAEWKERYAAARATAQASLALTAEAPVPNPSQLSVTAKDTVKSFTVKGTVATFKLVTKSQYNSSIGETCVGAHGLQACPVMQVTKLHTQTIRFEDWPVGVTFAHGDELSYYGDEKTETQGRGTDKEVWTSDIRGFHPRVLTKRDGTQLVYWERTSRP